MALMPLLNQHAGPLPLSVNFKAPSDGPATLVVSGSVWCQTANQMIGISVQLDGHTIGQAVIFSNLQATHRAVVPTYIPVKLTYGEHKLTLVAANAHTTSDYNDVYSIALDF